MGMTDLLGASLFYYKRGLPVFPFRKDKTGACVKWTEYQTAMPKEEDVRSWFGGKFKKDFIAISTGKYAGITVVDCDSEEAYNTVQEFIPQNLVTPTVKSPNGYHLYFKYRDGLINKANYMPGVDVRNDGGCIIAPPSTNGTGSYKWFSGLSMVDVQIATMPEELYLVLMQYLSTNKHSTNILGGVIGGGRQDSSLSSNVVKMFEHGRRDEDLFHTANCLTKGGMPQHEQRQVIERLILSWGENPDPKWVDDKIKSAFERSKKRDRTLAEDVREFVLSSNGVFLSSNVVNCLQVSSREERKNVSKILSRLQEENIIEKVGNRNGEWRLRDQSCPEMDWLNANCDYLPIYLPIGISEFAGVQPGNILIFAGSKDSGKTAWLLNIAKENRHKYQIHYFNSEMGESEFLLRVKKFDDIAPQQFAQRVKVYQRHDNFQDVICHDAESINIIDFLEVNDEFWKVGSMIRQIHERIGKSIVIIALQKKFGQDLGRGAESSLEKARLYVSLEKHTAKIVSCKNFKPDSPIGNPRGYTCKYKIVNGCKILKDGVWTGSGEQ